MFPATSALAVLHPMSLDSTCGTHSTVQLGRGREALAGPALVQCPDLLPDAKAGRTSHESWWSLHALSMYLGAWRNYRQSDLAENILVTDLPSTVTSQGCEMPPSQKSRCSKRSKICSTGCFPLLSFIKYKFLSLYRSIWMASWPCEVLATAPFCIICELAGAVLSPLSTNSVKMLNNIDHTPGSELQYY